MQPQSANRLVVPIAGMLIASVVLGLTYNGASPLGVRSAGVASAMAASPPASSGENLANETLALSLVSPGAAPSPGKVYQNETLAVALSFPPSAAPARPAGSSPAMPLAGAVPLPTRRPLPSLTWPEVKPLLAANQIVLVDARLAAHYLADHIPGAVLLTAHSPPAEMTAFAAKYPKSIPLVVYCGTDKCPMAHDLAESLISEYGYTNVKVMPGGYAEYRLAEARPATAAAIK